MVIILDKYKNNSLKLNSSAILVFVTQVNCHQVLDNSVSNSSFPLNSINEPRSRTHRVVERGSLLCLLHLSD